MIDPTIFFDHYRKTFSPLHQSQVDGLSFLIGKFSTHPRWTDIRHAAYALATIKIECGNTWQPIAEFGGRIYLSKYYLKPSLRRALGNIKLSDSWVYKGRGYVQITGRANYAKFGIEDSPEKALEPEPSFEIMTRGLFHGMFTGRKLTQYINGLMPPDYYNARRCVNGLDRASEIADYSRRFEKILRASTT